MNTYLTITGIVLEQSFKFLDEHELNQILHGIVPEKKASFNDAVRVVATARVDPAFREFLLGLIREYLADYVTSMQQMWKVSEADIEEFIKAKKLAGESQIG